MSSTRWRASVISSSARSRNATAVRRTTPRARCANGKTVSSEPGQARRHEPARALAVRSAAARRPRAGAAARGARARAEADRRRPRHSPQGQAMKKLLAAVAIGAAVTLGVAGCASQNPETKRSAGEFTDDAALTAKVKTAIATDVGARAAGSINVETYKGVVQLSGFVDNKDMAERALTAARKVNGVSSVKNDLRLKAS